MYTPDKDTGSSINYHIEQSFLRASVAAMELRTKLTMCLPGPTKQILTTFRKEFDYLVSISFLHRSMDAETANKSKLWLLSTGKTNPQYCFYGLNLFEQYSKELVKQGLIKYGAK